MKRANGTGSIVKKKGRSKPYLVYSPAHIVNEKRVVDYLGSFKRKIDAQNYLEEYNRDPSIYRNKMSFAQVFEEFKKTRRYEQISKSSKDGYEAAFKHCADLSRVRFSELRTGEMQMIIDRMERDGMSASSMQKVKVLFKVLFGYAMQNDIVKKDYAQFIVLPSVEEKEKRALTDLEIKKIKSAAEGGNKSAEWVLYLIYSGWRISEMLELTRFCYDPKEKTLRGGKKTKNGKNRLIPVHPTVQTIVEKQIAKNGATIFCMESGKPMTADYFRKFIFNPLLEELEIDSSLTPHNTRHTFATLLKRNGADEFYRKKLLGHSPGDVTNDVYTHEDIDSLRNAIMCVEKPSRESKRQDARTQYS